MEVAGPLGTPLGLAQRSRPGLCATAPGRRAGAPPLWHQVDSQGASENSGILWSWEGPTDLEKYKPDQETSRK